MPSPVFATTCWTQVLAAGDADNPAASEALEQLCSAYWFPLYAFVRRDGWDAHQAQDLAQGFFAHLLKRNDLAGLVRGEGRFRSFLLKSLTHFLINERTRAATQKRGGNRIHVSLDDESAEARYLCELAHEETPRKLFERQWALSLLHAAMRALEAEQIESGNERTFAMVRHFLSREPEPGEYAAVASQLELTPGALAVGVHRLRKRYRELVRAAVAETVDGPLEVEDEMRQLLAALR